MSDNDWRSVRKHGAGNPLLRRIEFRKRAGVLTYKLVDSRHIRLMEPQSFDELGLSEGDFSV